MFQIIKGIDIGQGPGNAFGGGIFAASCEIGFSNSPTRITLNIASENGQYQSVSPNVYTTPYNIDLNGKVFSGMYMYSYERTKQAGSSLMTVNFVDASIILDKVFVGLLHRHGNAKKETQVATGTFTVRCPTCADGSITNVEGSARRYLDFIPGGCYFERSEDGGGYIILGKENFPESNCEIPRVDYNFSEFCAALTSYGIQHELASFDLNPLYRQEYAGSLREVLNNWASDFSFEFFFDGNILKAIDLRKPINLSSVEYFADHSEYVTSMTFGETLENTYAQSVVARYLKPSTAIDYNNTFHFKQIAYPIGLADILNNGACAGRDLQTVMTCVGLSRLDNPLREAYIANMAVQKNDVRLLQALGFQYDAAKGLPYRLPQNTIAPLLKHLTSWNNELGKQGGANSQILSDRNYAVYIGLFREDIKQQIESWDNEACNFLGKYYRFITNVPANRFDCPYSRDWFIYYTADSRWETLPSSSLYGGDAVPFASLLRDPTSNTSMTNYFSQHMFSVEDNAWGIEPTTYETSKGTSNYDFLKPIIIPFDEMPIAQGTALQTLTQVTPQGVVPTDVYTNLVDRQKTDIGAVIAFLVVPLMANFTSAPKISGFGRTINRSVYNRVTSHTDRDEQAARCVTYCDSNIVSELCACGSQYTPVPYFQNLSAPYVQVKHSNGNVSNIVFPVDSNYFGYFVHTRYFKTTNPPIKSIYGKPPNLPTNTMATRVNDYDITPDLDAVMDNNDAVNQYIYSPTNEVIMTAQAYYDSLANLNNLVVPPQRNLKISIARTDLENLDLPLSPADGLTNLAVSISDGGVVTDLSYATRPPVVPRAEAIFSKIKYRLKN